MNLTKNEKCTMKILRIIVCGDVKSYLSIIFLGEITYAKVALDSLSSVKAWDLVFLQMLSHISLLSKLFRTITAIILFYRHMHTKMDQKVLRFIKILKTVRMEAMIKYFNLVEPLSNGYIVNILWVL
jgi:hypothetical protein